MTTRIGGISISITLLAIFGITTSQALAGEKLYSITDIGTLNVPPTSSDATGINDLGQVVGTSQFFFAINIFRTAPNQPINPATDEVNRGVSRNSNSGTINDLGQVVGNNLLGSGDTFAFRTAPNSPFNSATDNLGALGTPFTVNDRGVYTPSTFATAINNLGQVVGRSEYRYTGSYHAFRTAPNSPINPSTVDPYSPTINPSTDDLGTLGGITSSAAGINEKGQVVGQSQVAMGSSSDTHAFRTAANSPINPATDDLGTLGGRSSVATGINKRGRVVGRSELASGETHAFRTAPNNPINPETDDLGTLGGTSSSAFGINNKGEVVGTSSLEGDQVNHAFLYRYDEMKDLNSLVDPNSFGGFSSLNKATAINNKGQIVGQGTLANGGSHAFLATPIDNKILRVKASK